VSQGVILIVFPQAERKLLTETGACACGADEAEVGRREAQKYLLVGQRVWHMALGENYLFSTEGVRSVAGLLARRDQAGGAT
jgi:hypothetical protein